MEMLVGHVRLDSLTYQSRRYFVLPRHELPDGAVRFIDRGFLGRQLRIIFGTFPLAMAALLFYLGLQPLLHGLPRAYMDNFLFAAGAVAAVIGCVMILPWARTRTIDVDPGGAVTIHDHSPNRPYPPTRPRAHLELRPVHALAGRLQWRPFGLFASDGVSSAALCFALTPEGCLNALGDMPEQVRRIPLEASEHVVVASIVWT